MYRHVGAACAFLLLAVALGCGKNDGRPVLARVSGNVTYNGKPLVGASVCFFPEQPGIRSALGMTDEQGNYTLFTYDPNDGAPVGRHKVAISLRGPAEKVKLDPSVQTKFGEAYYEQLGGTGKALIPEKYLNSETSGLTANVVAGRRNTADFTLTGELPGKAVR